MENIEQIIVENDRRNEHLFATYNPYTGIGSLIPREPFYLSATNLIYIPSYLYSTSPIQSIVACGSLEQWAQSNNTPLSSALDFINRLRLKYDFEFWCATCCIIHDKLTGKEIPLILRPPQRIVLAKLVEQLFSNLPVRMIILKARQWGGSTLVDMFEAWIQIFHKSGWNSCIVAHIKDAAYTIRSMYSLMIRRHPKDIQPLTMACFEGSQTTKKLLERDAIISVGTAQKPESLRSQDIKLIHASEVGLWKDTAQIKAEDLLQTIVASVPIIPFSVIVLESTAKGIGNMFERTWRKAERGESIYTPIFVAWYQIELYRKPFADERQKREFATSLTAEEQERWKLGATLEGLNWYRDMLASMNGNTLRMMQEYPSTPQEAFTTTSRAVHNASDIQFLLGGTTDPKYRGEMVATAMYGREAIDTSMEFRQNPNGNLWLWALPDKSENIINRYVVSMDIGGRSEDADWTVISVIDRKMLMKGGVEECIGTYRFHMDQDLSVWKAVQVAKYFNDALLVVEYNSLDTKGAEGDQTYTILDQIVDMYPNIYYRDDPTKIREGLAPHYGFHTNRSTKQDLINHMQHLLRDKAYIERDKRALDEASNYEQKEQRDVYGAIEGEHDDIYMSRAIGLKVSDKMELPAVAMEYKPSGNLYNENRTHASI